MAHAESRLAPTGTRRPTEVLPLYKKFLKVEEHRLRLRHQAGGSGREICAGRAQLVDVLLRYVFGAASSAAARENGESEVPLALIALGGYGRGELNPFSDVDVMLLHAFGFQLAALANGDIAVHLAVDGDRFVFDLTPNLSVFTDRQNAVRVDVAFDFAVNK